MPAALTHKSIMLLARRRLGVIYRALEAKQNAGGPVTDLERRIAHLARKTYEMLSASDPVALEGSLAMDPLAQGVSQYAVMGAMGPDIPAFSALLAAGQGWIFDTVHKGSPDRRREYVHAGTIDFILTFWQKVSTAIGTGAGSEAALQRMRAYVLGHLAHIAGDVISHPYTNDVEWHAAPSRLTHDKTEASLDAQVALQVLGRDGTRGGQAWDVWWPKADQVPAQFAAAYADALEEVYQLRTRRRTGFREYEREHEKHNPPSLDAGLIADGYHVYRHGAIGIGYGWGWGKWFGLLTILFVPLLAAPYLVFALPNARQLYRPPQAGDDVERGWWELLNLPLALTAHVPVVLGGIVMALTSKGVKGYSITGLVFSVLSGALAIPALILAFQPDAGPAGLRWPLFFALPAAAALVQLFFALFGDGLGSTLLGVVHSLPLLVTGAFFLVLFLLVLIARLAGANADVQQGMTIAFLALWTVGMLACWIVFPFLLRNAKIPEEAEEFAITPHLVRLFDDATLFHEPPSQAPGQPAPPPAAPALAERFFPSSWRPLIKLWWEGSGTMTVRSDRFQLVFRPEGVDDGSQDKVARAPIEPLTVTGYIHLLERLVPGVKGTVVEPEDPDYVLPPGASFADHGDVEDDKKKQPKLADRNQEATKFEKLGSSADDTDYVLHHARRSDLAVRFGPLGPVSSFDWQEAAAQQTGDAQGYRYVHDPVGVAEDKVMDFAADFAALLMLGGASHLLPAGDRAVTKAGQVEELQQVFRNWCLDRRRVNEWRMLVAGGAVPEKGARPEGKDPLMPKATPESWTSPLFAAGQAPFAAGERTAHEQGWVPLLRKWFDAARRPDQDVLAATRLNENDPTNLELSRGMAYLLDMPDPQAAP